MAIKSGGKPGEKVEVTSLSSGSLIGGRDDLSAGKAPDIPALLGQDIKDRERLRTFQTVAFYGAITLIFFVFCSLFHWVNLVGDHIRDTTVITTYRVSFFVAPIVVLGTLGALLTLALLKLAFRAPGDKKDDETSFITLLQGLGTQALEIWKSYAGKKAE